MATIQRKSEGPVFLIMARHLTTAYAGLGLTVNMAELNEIYARADYYDIAFARDIEREVKFIHDLQRHRTGRELESMLEIACGPGYHARAFARNGVTTYGLDLRPEMIELAREMAAADGVSVEWTAADMRYFTLPQPVDAIVTLYDSLDCLLTNEELADHFRRSRGESEAGRLLSCRIDPSSRLLAVELRHAPL